MEWLIVIAALFLAFSNGANDNFKGFATIWGSDTLNYRQALTLATLATLAGCFAALFLAESLVQNFSGKGLVADTVVNTPLFILSVSCGAAVTIFLATRLGYPVSTTHALIGALIGASRERRTSRQIDANLFAAVAGQPIAGSYSGRIGLFGVSFTFDVAGLCVRDPAGNVCCNRNRRCCTAKRIGTLACIGT